MRDPHMQRPPPLCETSVVAVWKGAVDDDATFRSKKLLLDLWSTRSMAPHIIRSCSLASALSGPRRLKHSANSQRINSSKGLPLFEDGKPSYSVSVAACHGPLWVRAAEGAKAVF